MFPYLFFLINFLTEVAHKTKLVRQRVRSHVSSSHLKKRGAEPRGNGSFRVFLGIHPRHTVLLPRSFTRPQLHRHVGWTFCFLTGYWCLRIKRKILKTEPESSQHLEGSSTTTSRRALYLTMPRSLASPGLPPFIPASQLQLSPSPSTSACMYTLSSFSGILLLFSRQKRSKTNLCQVFRAEQEGMKAEQLGMKESSKVQTERNPWLSIGTGLQVGRKASDWPGAMPPSPWPPTLINFQQAAAALCICFPPIESKQKQLCPAPLRPTSRLAICTHAQWVIPSYNSSNVLHTRDRSAKDNPRLWHIHHHLPGWALLRALPPPGQWAISSCL